MVIRSAAQDWSDANDTGGGGTNTLTVNFPSGIALHAVGMEINSTTGAGPVWGEITCALTNSGGAITLDHAVMRTTPPKVDKVAWIGALGPFDQPMQLYFTGYNATGAALTLHSTWVWE